MREQSRGREVSARPRKKKTRLESSCFPSRATLRIRRGLRPRNSAIGPTDPLPLTLSSSTPQRRYQFLPSSVQCSDFRQHVRPSATRAASRKRARRKKRLIVSLSVCLSVCRCPVGRLSPLTRSCFRRSFLAVCKIDQLIFQWRVTDVIWKLFSFFILSFFSLISVNIHSWKSAETSECARRTRTYHAMCSR